MQNDKTKVKSKDTASNKSTSKEQNNIFAFLPTILVFGFLGDCHAEFILSFGRFFDRLRMSGDEGLAMTGKNDKKETLNIHEKKLTAHSTQPSASPRGLSPGKCRATMPGTVPLPRH